MDCCEFREKYSDYTDGLLSREEARDARSHLLECEGCRRFDAAFRAGVSALRALPAVELSRGFGARLRASLRREFHARGPVIAHWSGAFGTLLMIAAVGFLGWQLLPQREAHYRLGNPPVRTAERPRPLTPLPAARPVTAARHQDTVVIPLDTFHPLQSILVASDPSTEMDSSRPRVDISVVWGGE
jgi:anti-sigma factor RsiW